MKILLMDSLRSEVDLSGVTHVAAGFMVIDHDFGRENKVYEYRLTLYDKDQEVLNTYYYDDQDVRDWDYDDLSLHINKRMNRLPW